jgi:mannosyltransferase
VNVVRWRITRYEGALLAIVLLGASLRVYQITTESVGLDEAFSVWISQMSLSQIAATAAGADWNPPLYYFLLHYWMQLFGTSAFAIRLPSTVFGVLAIPMIYVVGRQLFNKEVGLVAALILALSSYNIWYAQEARVYSLMVLLALLSMYFFLRFLERDNLALSAGYVLFTVLLVYGHSYGWFVVVAQNICVLSILLLPRNRTFRLRRWVVVQATVVALFVPWIFALINQISLQAATVSLPYSVSDALYSVLLHFGSTFISYSGTWVLSVLFLGLSVLSLFAYQKVRGAPDWKAPLKALQSYAWKIRRQDAAPVYFLAVWLLTIALIPLIVSRFYALAYALRYTIAASVALYLLVAKGIKNIVHKPVKLAVIAVIVLLSIANVQVYYTSTTRPQAREAISLIDTNAENGDVVLIIPSAEKPMFDYYNNRTDVVVPPLDFKILPPIDHPEDKANEIRSYVNGHDRVWLFAETRISGDATNLTVNTLNESYAINYKEHYYVPFFDVYDVYLFKRIT